MTPEEKVLEKAKAAFEEPIKGDTRWQKI